MLVIPAVCPPAAGPLEDYAVAFDELFSRLAQRRGFREYLTGLLAPRDRNKTLTGLAGSQPVEGAQHAAVQRLQYFLSQSTWDADEVNSLHAERRRPRRVLGRSGRSWRLEPGSAPFRDGHTETWWVTDAQLGWWGPDGHTRLVIALRTWLTGWERAGVLVEQGAGVSARNCVAAIGWQPSSPDP